MPKTTKLVPKRKKVRTRTQDFQQVVQELLRLQQEEKLRNDQLEALLVYACSLFIEQEVDRRVQKAISGRLSLDHLLEAL